jgi:hypothetical protein
VTGRATFGDFLQAARVRGHEKVALAQLS